MSHIIQRGGITEIDGELVRQAVIVKCNCGRKHEIEPFTGDNFCSCGQEYNAFGQELAPREQWGEETGECLADIYNPNHWMEA